MIFHKLRRDDIVMNTLSEEVVIRTNEDGSKCLFVSYGDPKDDVAYAMFHFEETKQIQEIIQVLQGLVH